MRSTRLIALIAAFGMLSFLPFLSVSSASATQPHAAPASVSAPATSAKPVRSVGAKIVSKKKGKKLVMLGVVRPAKGPVVIMKATRCNKKGTKCNFKKYRKVGVNKKGRYATRVEAPRRGNWYWIARVGTVRSDIWRTYRL